MNNMKLFEILWFWRKRIIEKAKKEDIIYFDVWDEDIFKPSQKDKPSPHSSIPVGDLWWRHRKAYPEKHFKTYFVQNTNSMEPFIDDNCVVTLETMTSKMFKDAPISVGDVAIWAWDRRGKIILVIHRITKIRKNDNGIDFWFKGDNNFNADGWIPDELVQARMIDIGYGKLKRKGD